MILRIVRGRAAADRFDGVVAPFEDRFLTTAGSTPGLVRCHVAVRGVDGTPAEVVVVTFWETVEAALDADRGHLDEATALDGADSGMRREVAYFEVDDLTLRRSDADWNVLRITVGRVARGLDAEIQHELRTRMHGLEGEMTEGYVGRRILGDDVEIAFISAWERPPATRSLEAPFWTDISERYDAFEVATYEPIASGAAVR